MGANLFIGIPWIEVALKNGMGYVKINGFHDNPLCDSRELGYAYEVNLI